MSKVFKLNGAEEFYQSLIATAPEWFAKYRQRCLEQSRTVELPSLKDEEWKYTSLALLRDHDYQLPSHHDLDDKEQIWKYIDKSDYNFVLVNGCFISELSNFKGIDGLTSMHTQEAINQGLITQEQIEATTKNDIEPFLSINGAYHRCGAYINVNKKFDSKKLIHIVHINTDKGAYSISPRSFINIERSAQASIMESHISINDAPYFVNPLTDMYLRENATLHYVKAQKDSNEAVHIGQTRVWQDADSTLKSCSVMLGGKLTRNNLTITHKGEGVYSMINGLYLVDGDRHVDNHSLINHDQPNCESHQLYKGILRDKSRSVFNGKINVDSIAQKTDAYQLNKNLILGVGARVDTKPQLEIFADDVKCTHGAAIGRLNEDEIFYLQTRNISRHDAIELMSEGFINDVLDQIEIESIRTKINALRN